MKIKLLAYLNVLSLIAVILVNGLASYLPINGQNTGQISDKYPTLFTPAGITFAIWGVIYILLIIFVVYQLKLAYGNKKDQSVVEVIGPWFIISSLLNIAWIFAWHYEKLSLSMLLMAGLLISLIAIYVNLRMLTKQSVAIKNYVIAPFSVYLGWISVATIANAAILLSRLGWNGFGINPAIWTVIMLAVGLGLSLTMVVKNKDYAYAAVILWAYFGIILKRLADNSQPDLGIIITASLSMVVILIVMLFQLKHEKV